MPRTCLLLGLTALLLGPAGIQAQNLLPRGFKLEAVASGFDFPISMDQLPDGRFIVAEQFSGLIKIASGAQVSVMGLVSGLSTGGMGDRGLLAIAIDPQFPARPYLYALYNHAPSAAIRLSMFTLNTVLGQLVMSPTPYQILDDILDQDTGHNGGCLRFGTDGMLYASLGDDFSFCLAQDPNVLNGSLLRLDVSALPLPGTGPAPKALIAAPGNPFGSPLPNTPLVWAYGLRNPFRFQIDSGTGDVFLTDVGQASWEEVDRITTGGQNLGWPFFEGPASFPLPCGPIAPNLTLPIFSASHPNAHAFIAMAVYRNPLVPSALAFGPEYEGHFFFADFDYGYIQRIRAGGGPAWTLAPAVAGQIHPDFWAGGQIRLVDARLGADGALYFIRYYSPGSITRIVPDTAYPGNGSDCAILIDRNGQPDPRNDGIHHVQVNESLVIRCLSPGGTRTGIEAAMFAEAIVPANPMAPQLIPGDATAALWLSFAATPIFNGLGVGGPFLDPGPGFILPPVVIPPWAASIGLSIMLQLFTWDPGLNIYNIGASRAVEVRVH